MGMYSRGICILCDSMQGLFVFAAVCLAAVVAVPRVRHEDRWHPSPPRDISQYRPRGDMFPMDAATAAAMPKQTPRQRSPITKSIYNLAEECGVEGPPAQSSVKEAGQKWDQVGIVSFGSSAGCEKGYPAAFTRTEYYREWIETNSGV